MGKKPFDMNDKEYIDYLNTYKTESNNEDNHDSGINFATHQQFQPEVFTWEKEHGVYTDPMGKFKDMPLPMNKEVDLKNDNSGGIGLSEKDNCGDCYGC